MLCSIKIIFNVKSRCKTCCTSWSLPRASQRDERLAGSADRRRFRDGSWSGACRHTGRSATPLLINLHRMWDTGHRFSLHLIRGMMTTHLFKQTICWPLTSTCLGSQCCQFIYTCLVACCDPFHQWVHLNFRQPTPGLSPAKRPRSGRVMVINVQAHLSKLSAVDWLGSGLGRWRKQTDWLLRLGASALTWARKVEAAFRVECLES